MKHFHSHRLLPVAIVLFCTVALAQTNPKPSVNKTENKSNMTTQTADLKEYILMVRVPINYGPEQAAEARTQWNALLEKWKMEDIYVISFVHPTDGYTVSGSDKIVRKESTTSAGLKQVSSIILKAADDEGALDLAKSCPVLAQGGLIEIRPVQPRPQPAR